VTRRRTCLLATLVTTLMAAGCEPSVRVNTDYDRDVVFQDFKTYAWLPEPAGAGFRPQLRNDLIDARVRRAVDRELAAKGLARTDPASADLGVTFYVSLAQTIQVDTVPTAAYGYGYSGWHGSMVATETRVRQYEEGTLLLDIVDQKRKQLIWRGSGRTRVKESSTPEETDALVNTVVAKILSEFPPGSPKG
jgi:hypothetical protein